MAKRILALLLAAALVLSVGGCARQPRIVGLFLAQTEGAGPEHNARLLKEALAARGDTVQVYSAELDQSKQLKQLQKMLEEGCDLLVVEPVMAAGAGEIAALAANRRVPLILLGKEPEPQVLSTGQTCYVGYDPAQPGVLQGQMVLDLPECGDLNGDGVLSYYLLGGPEDHTDTRLRLTGCEEALAQTGLELQCLGTGWGDGSRDRAFQLAAGAIARWGKDMELILCADDTLAVGALDAIADGGRTVGADVYLLGIGGSQHARALLRSGELTGTVAEDPQTLAEVTAEQANILLSGNTPEPVTYVPYVPLTAADNP